MKVMRNILLAAGVLMLVACAELNSVHRTHNFKNGSALIDIKQRAILAGTETSTDVFGNKVETLMLCAEPSPDAMSAFAAELAAKVNIPESVAVELAGAFQESSSYVGMRTQSIQLLRDRSYRLCEARMNGFITEDQFALQMRRQQRNTVALLAIEQLTGPLKAPTVAINTKGTASIARNVEELVAQQKKLQEELAAKKKERDDVTGEDDAAKAKKEALDKEVTELDKSLTALEEGIKNGRSLVATGSATAVVLAGDLPQRSDAHIQAVAQTVDKIVKYTQTDDFGQMCLIHLGKNLQGPMTKMCTNFLQGVVDRQAAITKVMSAFGEKMGTLEELDVQELETLMRRLNDLSTSFGGEIKMLSPQEGYGLDIKTPQIGTPNKP